jgi:hypothetical protein
VRSWKQITKFRPAGAAPVSAPVPTASAEHSTLASAQSRLSEGPAPSFSLEGLIRDERGVRYAPEAED